MQRHKSVEKRDRQSKKANLKNRMGRSRIRNAVKHVLEAKDKDTAQTALNNAKSVLDKSAKTGVIHKNKAANQKSRLSKIVKNLAS